MAKHFMQEKERQSCFQHVLGAIGYYDGVDKKEIDESNDPNKLRIIQEIREAGLNVIHIIQRWNLTEKEAFEVESALIDAFPGLANIQSGHGSEYSVCNADELEARLSAKHTMNHQTLSI